MLYDDVVAVEYCSGEMGIRVKFDGRDTCSRSCVTQNLSVEEVRL
jgi:hypothetical protein